MNRERRFIPIENMRAVKSDDGKMIIEGYPIVYNTYADLWGFREIIRPGSAGPALKRSDEVVLWNHESGQPMARKSNGTLEVREDEKGVFIRADVSKTRWGRDGYEAIQNKITDKMSFAFDVASGGENWIQEEFAGVHIPVREITEFSEIYDYSPVTYPAYKDTELQARDAELATRNMPSFPTGNDDTSTEGEGDAVPVSTLLKINNLRGKIYDNSGT